MRPVWNEPVLTFELEEDGVRHTYLVASELHIGIEGELAKRGAFLRSRTDAMLEHLVRLLRENRADRLLLLGDVKHHVTHLSRQERWDLPRFFAGLGHLDRIDVTVGNHDTGLADLVPARDHPNLRFHPAGGTVLEGRGQRVGALHGHAWPSPEIVRADTILLGHTHAAYALVDERGESRIEWAWLRARLDPAAVHERYDHPSDARVIVFPPFNPLCGGTPMNRDGLLGPVARLLDPTTTEVHLLDGRQVGALEPPLTRRVRGAAEM